MTTIIIAFQTHNDSLKPMNPAACDSESPANFNSMTQKSGNTQLRASACKGR